MPRIARHRHVKLNDACHKILGEQLHSIFSLRSNEDGGISQPLLYIVAISWLLNDMLEITYLTKATTCNAEEPPKNSIKAWTTLPAISENMTRLIKHDAPAEGNMIKQQ